MWVIERDRSNISPRTSNNRQLFSEILSTTMIKFYTYYALSFCICESRKIQNSKFRLPRWSRRIAINQYTYISLFELHFYLTPYAHDVIKYLSSSLVFALEYGLDIFFLRIRYIFYFQRFKKYKPQETF